MPARGVEKHVRTAPVAIDDGTNFIPIRSFIAVKKYHTSGNVIVNSGEFDVLWAASVVGFRTPRIGFVNIPVFLCIRRVASHASHSFPSTLGG